MTHRTVVLDVDSVEYQRDPHGRWSIIASPRITDLESKPGPLLSAALDALAAARQKAAGWRCFHCGYLLLDEAEAQAHFGARDVAPTPCQVQQIEKSFLRATKRVEEERDAALQQLAAARAGEGRAHDELAAVMAHNDRLSADLQAARGEISLVNEMYGDAEAALGRICEAAGVSVNDLGRMAAADAVIALLSSTALQAARWRALERRLQDSGYVTDKGGDALTTWTFTANGDFASVSEYADALIREQQGEGK